MGLNNNNKKTLCVAIGVEEMTMQFSPKINKSHILEKPFADVFHLEA